MPRPPARSRIDAEPDRTRRDAIPNAVTWSTCLGGLPEAWRIAPAIVGEERGEVFEVAGVPRAEPRKGPETRLHSYRITRL